MAATLSELFNALDGKRAALEELVALLEEEQRSIVEIDIANLEMLDERKRKILGTLERSNAECRRLVLMAGTELSLTGTDSLSPLIAKAPAQLRLPLKNVQARLVELGESLARIIDFNRDLLDGSLRHVQESLTFLSSFFTQRSTYGVAGSMVQSRNDVRLVCKEI
jgi:flagellar biosynthesis/type III secretory pathway chaperone